MGVIIVIALTVVVILSATVVFLMKKNKSKLGLTKLLVWIMEYYVYLYFWLLFRAVTWFTACKFKFY